VSRLLIIQSQPLPDLGGCNTNGGVQTGIVVGTAPEYFNTDDSLLEILVSSIQATISDEPQKIAIAFAVTEQRVGYNSLQLLAYSSGIHYANGLRRFAPLLRVPYVHRSR